MRAVCSALQLSQHHVLYMLERGTPRKSPQEATTFQSLERTLSPASTLHLHALAPRAATPLTYLCGLVRSRGNLPGQSLDSGSRSPIKASKSNPTQSNPLRRPEVWGLCKNRPGFLPARTAAISCCLASSGCLSLQHASILTLRLFASFSAVASNACQSCLDQVTNNTSTVSFHLDISSRSGCLAACCVSVITRP